MKSSSNSFIARFLQQESSGGILLVSAAFLAILLANSPLYSLYQLLIDIPVAIRIGALEIAKPMLLWVNDGLMAIFFLLVGLELKREFLEGELSNRKKIMLPGLGALGGMAVPAGIYVFLNWDNPAAMNGWAIPTATDIAFALGVLSLLGSRVPTSLKVFLTSLAIFDDLGAILIIAFFYTSNISLIALIIAALCILLLFLLNKRGVVEKSLYLVVGAIMWVALLKSGVHATLTGVILAMFIPMRSQVDPDHSPLKSMEQDLHSAVAFFILPVFAFCNSGVNFDGLGLQQVLHPVPLGIALGLFLGKQIGVFAFCWLGIKLRFAELPKEISWTSLYGTAALCGIGFTMSLFIGSLAFEETGVNKIIDERLGIILGSLASGIVGYLILHRSLRSNN
ncbi:MAG TPA: Na+/H+ antiporter NhaA [Bacteroidota bacterium]